MIGETKRKSLLYKSRVEYGSWTINHVVGCMHGCKFPCYAFIMSKRFGRVKCYEDWIKPKIVANALEILEKEIPRCKGKLDFVHLSFMTDPFMYDSQTDDLIPEIKDLTLKIVERLNRENIRVTVLTKGFYPDEILSEDFLENNEYGITLEILSAKSKLIIVDFSCTVSYFSNNIFCLFSFCIVCFFNSLNLCASETSKVNCDSCFFNVLNVSLENGELVRVSAKSLALLGVILKITMTI